MTGLKAELDASKKEMEKTFANYNLQPYMQQAWSKLQSVYTIPGMGFFLLNPKKLRMENLNAKNDRLNISIGISASPVISFAPQTSTPSPVPPLSDEKGSGGFNIFLEAALQYDSLSHVLNGFLAGKRFDISEGIIKKHIVVEKTTVSGTEEGLLSIQVNFSGSFNGTASFVGKPVYNLIDRTIEVENLDYDLRTKNLFLKTAK